MANKPISTGILVSSILGAALLAIAGIGFMQPTGEQSKLVYNGRLWCVSNFIEQEPTEILKDGRPRKDKLLDNKTGWIVRDQVEADSKAEAEAKAQKNGNGLFEPSDKVTLRGALSKTPPDEKFFTTHFNKGATVAGPCLGSGSSKLAGMWLSDRIRSDCFGIKPTQTSVNPQIDAGAGQIPNQSSTGGICVGGKGVPEAYAKIFVAAGKKFNINPAWIASIFAAENGISSGGVARVSVAGSSSWPSTSRSWGTSSAGAKGPMQFMDNTWPGYKVDGDGDGKKDVQNLYDAIFSGANLIHGRTGNMSAKNPTDSMMRRSAIAYNCGPGCLSYKTLPSETLAYIEKTRVAFGRYNCP